MRGRREEGGRTIEAVRTNCSDGLVERKIAERAERGRRRMGRQGRIIAIR